MSFRYPFMDEDHKNSRSDNVLNDISFSIAPGERIAVVGVKRIRKNDAYQAALPLL
nr:hypothetical protein P5665_06015 [Bacillus subtilis]